MTSISESTQWDWNKEIELSHKLPDEYSVVKYLSYTITLALNDLVYQIDRLVQWVFEKLGWQRTPKWQWWNHILTHSSGSKLYLGALPIQKKIGNRVIRDDSEALIKLGIKTVLTLTEPFEVKSRGMITSPITPEQWQAKNIKHLIISTPDFGTIEMSKVCKGVSFLEEQLKEGSVYVHCKAGRGRSGLVSVCYAKSRFYNFEAAYAFVKRGRPQVSLEKAKQITAKQFFNSK